MQKNFKKFPNNLNKLAVFLLTVLTTWSASSQIYFHDFGTEFITEYPYTTAPNIVDENLSNAAWTNNTGAWVSFVGITGEALGLSNASGAASVTLTFDVDPGKQLEIDSFDFWRKRTNSGPQNWSMAINGITVGNGTSTTAGSYTGILAVANEVSGLTGTVNIVISLSASLGVGSFMIDDFTLNGTITDAPVPCTPAVISNIAPQSGPANTVVTITGSGFEAGSGTTSLQFNGIEAADYTVISDTEIETIVPATATTGVITVITDECITDSGDFTVLASDCPETSAPQDIYISELYDHVPGSYGVIELYNPTGSTITFNGEYVLERYGDIGGGTPSYTLVLTGSIGPESTYLVESYGTGVMGCSVVTNASMGQGINGNDEFKIVKNSEVIDIAQAPPSPGYTVIRQPGAIAPSTDYTNSDWSFSSNNCADLGNHTANFFPPASVITVQPEDVTLCEGEEAIFTVSISSETGFTYQWKTSNASGNWVDVTNNADISGANTAILTISNTDSDLNNSQFYCEISSASCDLISNAAQLIVTPAPVIAATVVTQPTCNEPTGTIAITAPTGAGLTYSINGTEFQDETTFEELNPGTYTITVENTDGCSSVTNPITINPVPTAPAVATTTVTQPTCEEPTGIIEITAPTGAGLTYSINGTDFQDETTFEGLEAGTYIITVQNTDGCESFTGDIVVNPVPNAPAVAITTVTQPTCEEPTGIIEITAPTGAGLTYSIDGIDFQDETTFQGLTPGNYTVTVQNAEGCESVTGNIIINTVPNAPAVATTTVTQPTCDEPTGIIEITAPTGAGLTYSIDGIDFQDETAFQGLTPGNYTVTVQNAEGCESITGDIVVNTVPNAPAVATTTVTQPTCDESNGTIAIIAPTGAGLTYSIDGTEFQEETIFDGLAAGTYIITVQNTEGCESVTNPITINPSSGYPELTVVQDCREEGFGSNYILEVLALEDSFDIGSADFEWQDAQGNTIGFNENTFNVTQYATDNTISADTFPLEFTVTVTTQSGCQTSYTFTVDSYFCSIPRGISPNNDGLNDSFDISGLNAQKLTIFNRYGKEVYTKNDYRNEWFGQSDNDDELPTGTYYYVIDAEANSATGWVYINRQD